MEHEICPECGLDVNLRGRRFMRHVTSRYAPPCRMSDAVAPSKRSYEERERFHYTGIATLTAAAILAASIALAAPAQAEPAAPTPDPNAPKCLTVAGQPLPHLQYLPCGWDWDGVNWIPQQP